MGYPGSVYHLRAFQLDRLPAQVVEQSHGVTQQYGYQVNVYLLKKSRSDALLHDTSGAHTDVLLLTCACFRLCSTVLWTPSVTNVKGYPL